MRVQIPAYTDRWMRGDRYGEVTKVTKSSRRLTASLNARNKRQDDNVEIAHVLLDKSGLMYRVILSDCEVI